VNPRSETGFAVDREDGVRLFYKRVDSVERLCREVQAHQHAARVAGYVDGVEVPRLFGIVPDRCLLLMAPIEARDNLFNYLWNGCSMWRRASLRLLPPERIGELLGTWFRRYHTPVTGSGIEGRQRVSQLATAACGRLKSTQFLRLDYLGGPVRDALLAYLSPMRRPQDAEREMSASSVVCVHGDPNLSSVLVTAQQRLAIIDFGDSGVGLGGEDVVSIWQTIWAISELSKRHKRLLTPCLEALIQHYGKLDYENPLFQFLRTSAAITQILVGLKTFRGRGPNRKLADVNRRWLLATYVGGHDGTAGGWGRHTCRNT
jgi:tRNA A-37 threonylcarbamoyl transferase component Bud32